MADAVDSSGHKVTYTFELSEEGNVVGEQRGYFVLSGINVKKPGTVTITATADDAASVVGKPIKILTTDSTSDKVIAIYNNSTENIYPIIETPIQPVDYWMQSLFKITNIGTYTFTTTKQYRVYINPTGKGIPPGGHVTISVPFYTKLVAKPSGGNVPDQYADWWDAIRVYIYDVQNNMLVNGYNLDSQVRTYSRSLTCLAPSTACTPGQPFKVYAGFQGLPLSDPNQLTEYTFADVVTSQGVPT